MLKYRFIFHTHGNARRILLVNKTAVPLGDDVEAVISHATRSTRTSIWLSYPPCFLRRRWHTHMSAVHDSPNIHPWPWAFPLLLGVLKTTWPVTRCAWSTLLGHLSGSAAATSKRRGRAREERTASHAGNAGTARLGKPGPLTDSAEQQTWDSMLGILETVFFLILLKPSGIMRQ
jgi:hypothetical protein